MAISSDPDDTHPRLGAVPLPLPHEHLAGYVRRLAAANGLTQIDQFYRLIGVRRIEPTGSDETWRALATATGFDEASFSHLRLPEKAWQRHGPFTVDGLEVSTQQMVGVAFRCCPQCLREDGIVRSRWFLHHVTACLKHGSALVDVCTCGRALTHRYLRLDLTCTCSVSVGEIDADLSSAAEDALCTALGEEPRGGPVLAAGFMALPAQEKLAVIERVGTLALLAAEDAPLTKRNTFFPKKPDAIPTGRSLAGSRAVVEAAIAILADWPAAYRRLLDGLVDRAPYREEAWPILRRLQTKAGFLAVRPLRNARGEMIGFINDERDRFMREVLGVRMYQGSVRPTGPAFEPVSGGARAASLKLRPEDYMPAKEAAAALGGTAASGLQGWVAAGLVELQRSRRGGHLVVRQSVLDALALFRNLPPDDGRTGLVGFSVYSRQLGRGYNRGDFLLDIVQGRIEAHVRHPEVPAIESLAVSAADLARQAATARVGRHILADEFLESRRLRRRLSDLWTDCGPMDVEHLKHLVSTGAVRSRVGKHGHEYSVHDMADHLQRNGPTRFFDLERADGRHRGGWRDLTVEPPSSAELRLDRLSRPKGAF